MKKFKAVLSLGWEALVLAPGLLVFKSVLRSPKQVLKGAEDRTSRHTFSNWGDTDHKGVKMDSWWRKEIRYYNGL